MTKPVIKRTIGIALYRYNTDMNTVPFQKLCALIPKGSTHQSSHYLVVNVNVRFVVMTYFI